MSKKNKELRPPPKPKPNRMPTPCGRWWFYRQAFKKPLWLVILAIWAVISNADTIAEHFIQPLVSAEFWAKWKWVAMTTNWPWYVWVIGSLIILAGGVAETSFRLYRRTEQELVTTEKTLEDERERDRVSHPPGLAEQIERMLNQGNPLVRGLVRYLIVYGPQRTDAPELSRENLDMHIDWAEQIGLVTVRDGICSIPEIFQTILRENIFAHTERDLND